MRKIIGGVLVLLLSFQTLFAYTENELFSANILVGRGIIAEQTNPQEYRLNDTITRKEFMKVVAGVAQDTIEDTCENKFSDVVNDWGCKYIEWALKKEFIAANTSFRPNANITKAESMKLILKTRGISRSQDSGDWRADDMMAAYMKGIIGEVYNDYDSEATRGWIFETAATETGTYSLGGSENNEKSRILDPMNPNDVP